MKKILSLVMVMAMVFALASCGGTPPAASDASAGAGTPSDDPYAHLEPVELIGADSTGKGAAGEIFGELVASKVAGITGGKLTIDYHPNGILGGDADLLRQMQNNDIQVVVCQTAPTVSFIPAMAVFDLPMVFAKYGADTIDAVLNGPDSQFRAELSAAYENAGLHLLGFLQNGTYRLTTSNRALKTLEDFAGLQIRTMENANHMDFWTAIGAEPTPLTWAEVYSSLHFGAIDAQENAADTCVGANMHEVQKYLSCTNHILYVNQICINAEAYAELEPAYRAALDQAVTEALAEMNPRLAQIDMDSKAILEQGGMTITTYGPEFYDAVLALRGVQELYTRIDGETGGLGQTLQTALEATA